MEPINPQTPQERNELINAAVEKIAADVQEKAKYRDAEGNPEYISLCILNMIEWQVDQLDRKIVAKRLLQKLSSYLPLESKGIIRKYFDIFS